MILSQHARHADGTALKGTTLRALLPRAPLVAAPDMPIIEAARRMRAALAKQVARETFRLSSDKALLETLIADVPVGVVLTLRDLTSDLASHTVREARMLSAIVFGSTETHSLDALAVRLGMSVSEEERHTAMGDTIATADAFLRLIPILKARGFATFGDVMVAMRRHGSLLADPNSAFPEHRVRSA